VKEPLPSDEEMPKGYNSRSKKILETSNEQWEGDAPVSTSALSIIVCRLSRSMSNLAGSTHQAIIGAGFQDTTSFAEAIIQATGPLSIIINKWNELHNELEVARLSPGSELHIKDKFALRLQVVFGGRSHALSYRPLILSLYQLRSVVEGIVSGIEAETARILRERSA
jgi:hypothetical protein